MDVDRLREIAGVDRFDRACQWSWKTAAGAGNGHPVEWPDDLSDVPHEIDDYWTDCRLTAIDRLKLAQTVYRLMPTYWNAVGQRHIRDDGGPIERTTYWGEVRALLDQPDDRLADPLSYDLWADTFEGPTTATEGWAELVATAPTQRRLERVIEISGPVRWELKAPLLERFAHSDAQHGRVARALVAGATEAYGAIDIAEAKKLLAGLRNVEHIATTATLGTACKQRKKSQGRSGNL